MKDQLKYENEKVSRLAVDSSHATELEAEVTKVRYEYEALLKRFQDLHGLHNRDDEGIKLLRGELEKERGDRAESDGRVRVLLGEWEVRNGEARTKPAARS